MELPQIEGLALDTLPSNMMHRVTAKSRERPSKICEKYARSSLNSASRPFFHPETNAFTLAKLVILVPQSMAELYDGDSL